MGKLPVARAGMLAAAVVAIGVGGFLPVRGAARIAAPINAVVFASERDGSLALWAVPASGGEPVRVFEGVDPVASPVPANT